MKAMVKGNRRPRGTEENRRSDSAGGGDATWNEVDTVHKTPATVRDLVDTDSQTVRTHMSGQE